jgi:tetratricopeptide (TPR) repeat protein
MAEGAEQKRVFISRSGADKALAAELGHILEDAGYSVILQQCDFGSKNFMNEMHEALVSGARVVALLSPDYLKSDHCQAEWTAAIHGDPLNRRERLVVLRVADCMPDGLLAPIPYFDLLPVLDHRPTLCDVVLDALHIGRRKGHGAAAPYWRAPRTIFDADAIRPTPSFTGRADELAAIAARFDKAPDTPAAIHGLGGVGKTSLAREYAWRNRDAYGAIAWIPAASETQIIDGLIKLGARFMPGLEAAQDRPAAAQRVQSELIAHLSRPALLIFDNAEDEGLLLRWRPRQNAHVLATSRMPTWSRDVAVLKPLEVWPLEEAIDYLCAATGEREMSRADAEAVSTAVDRLPLALSHAAAYLKLNRPVSVAAYLKTIARHMRQAPAGADYPAAVYATFQTAIEQAEALAPGAAALITLAAFYAPDDIPFLLLETTPDELDAVLAPPVGDHVGASLVPTLSDEILRLQALSALDRLSLIRFKPDAKTLSLHRLVQAAARDRLDAAAEAWAEAAVLVADGAYPYIEFANWPLCLALTPHAVSATTSALDSSGPPLARLLSQCGYFLNEQAAFAAAEPLNRRALKIREASYGENHPDVAQSLNNLGELLRTTNRLAEAEPLYRRALAINEASYGENHPEVAIGLNNLALLLRTTNRLAEAEQLYRRARAINEASYGENHPNVAKSLNNLALLLQTTNRLAEAEQLYRHALAISEASYGENHPDVAKSLNNLAGLLRTTNRLAEAEQLYRRALAIKEASYGENHPNVAQSLNNLAVLLQTTNRLAEAEPLYRRAGRVPGGGVTRDGSGAAREARPHKAP